MVVGVLRVEGAQEKLLKKTRNNCASLQSVAPPPKKNNNVYPN